MKTVNVILWLFLSGCTVFETKGQNVQQAVETAVNPERIEIHYKRDANTTHYYQESCSGEWCDSPPE